MGVDIFEYLSRDTLHDKVVESISTGTSSDGLMTKSCSCRLWDSNTNSRLRIYLIFENPRLEGYFDIGFEFFDAPVEIFGDGIRMTPNESASGLDTVRTCTEAVVRSSS
jgi:hypothetical protein